MTAHVRCAETHPALDVGGGRVIYGGSCAHPTVTDAWVYVGFDLLMKQTDRSFPWVEGEEFLYRIVDQGIPQNKETFKELIQYLSERLDDNAKIHIGCIGGHGRTGMVLAALVAYRKVSADPIKYVREHYCDKAVESKAQVEFLVDHWGCKPAAPSKAKAWSSGSAPQAPQGNMGKVYNLTKKADKVDSGLPIRSVESCIWSVKVKEKV